MKLQVFVVLMALACHLEHTSAVSCTAATANTCETSKYVTGTCTSEECVCKANSVAGKYGCQKMDKPIVSATSNGISTSGKFIDTATIILTCNVAGGGDVTYKWFKDGSGENVDTHDLTLDSLGVGNAGSYSCSFTANGVESEVSNPFLLQFVADFSIEGDHIKPVLNGLPMKAFDSQVLKLTCEGSPAGAQTSWRFEFKIDNSRSEASLSNTYDYNFVEANQALSCIAIKGDVELESENIANPQKLSTMPRVTITGPQMQVIGKPATLTCAIDDEDVSENGVTWSWTKDGAQIDSETSKAYTMTTVADGAYKCKVTPGVLEDQESDEFIVKAATVTHKVTANPEKALVGGYIAMTCSVEGAKSSADIKYIWKKGRSVLYGVDDNVIQLNEIVDGDQGDYTCNPIVGGVDMDDSTPAVFDASPVTLSATITPTISSSNETDGFYKAGKTYNLFCDSEYISPGVSFTWKKDETVVEEKNEKTMEIKAETTNASYSCQLSFNSAKSKFSAEIEVKGKAGASAVVTSLLGTVLTAFMTHLL